MIVSENRAFLDMEVPRRGTSMAAMKTKVEMPDLQINKRVRYESQFKDEGVLLQPKDFKAWRSKLDKLKQVVRRAHPNEIHVHSSAFTMTKRKPRAATNDAVRINNQNVVTSGASAEESIMSKGEAEDQYAEFAGETEPFGSEGQEAEVQQLTSQVIGERTEEDKSTTNRSASKMNESGGMGQKNEPFIQLVSEESCLGYLYPKQVEMSVQEGPVAYGSRLGPTDASKASDTQSKKRNRDKAGRVPGASSLKSHLAHPQALQSSSGEVIGYGIEYPKSSLQIKLEVLRALDSIQSPSTQNIVTQKTAEDKLQEDDSILALENDTGRKPGWDTDVTATRSEHTASIVGWDNAGNHSSEKLSRAEGSVVQTTRVGGATFIRKPADERPDGSINLTIASSAQVNERNQQKEKKTRKRGTAQGQYTSQPAMKRNRGPKQNYASQHYLRQQKEVNQSLSQLSGESQMPLQLANLSLLISNLERTGNFQQANEEAYRMLHKKNRYTSLAALPKRHLGRSMKPLAVRSDGASSKDTKEMNESKHSFFKGAENFRHSKLEPKLSSDGNELSAVVSLHQEDEQQRRIEKLQMYQQPNKLQLRKAKPAYMHLQQSVNKKESAMFQISQHDSSMSNTFLVDPRFASGQSTFLSNQNVIAAGYATAFGSSDANAGSGSGAFQHKNSSIHDIKISGNAPNAEPAGTARAPVGVQQRQVAQQKQAGLMKLRAQEEKNWLEVTREPLVVHGGQTTPSTKYLGSGKVSARPVPPQMDPAKAITFGSMATTGAVGGNKDLQSVDPSLGLISSDRLHHIQASPQAAEVDLVSTSDMQYRMDVALTNQYNQTPKTVENPTQQQQHWQAVPLHQRVFEYNDPPRGAFDTGSCNFTLGRREIATSGGLPGTTSTDMFPAKVSRSSSKLVKSGGDGTPSGLPGMNQQPEQEYSYLYSNTQQMQGIVGRSISTGVQESAERRLGSNDLASRGQASGHTAAFPGLGTTDRTGGLPPGSRLEPIASTQAQPYGQQAFGNVSSPLGNDLLSAAHRVNSEDLSGDWQQSMMQLRLDKQGSTNDKPKKGKKRTGELRQLRFDGPGVELDAGTELRDPSNRNIASKNSEMVISGSYGQDLSPLRNQIDGGERNITAGPIMLNQPSSEQLGLPRELASAAGIQNEQHYLVGNNEQIVTSNRSEEAMRQAIHIQHLTTQGTQMQTPGASAFSVEGAGDGQIAKLNSIGSGPSNEVALTAPTLAATQLVCSSDEIIDKALASSPGSQVVFLKGNSTEDLVALQPLNLNPSILVSMETKSKRRSQGEQRLYKSVAAVQPSTKNVSKAFRGKRSTTESIQKFVEHKKDIQKKQMLGGTRLSSVNIDMTQVGPKPHGALAKRAQQTSFTRATPVPPAAASKSFLPTIQSSFTKTQKAIKLLRQGQPSRFERAEDGLAGQLLTFNEYSAIQNQELQNSAYGVFNSTQQFSQLKSPVGSSSPAIAEPDQVKMTQTVSSDEMTSSQHKNSGKAILGLIDGSIPMRQVLKSSTPYNKDLPGGQTFQQQQQSNSSTNPYYDNQTMKQEGAQDLAVDMSTPGPFSDPKSTRKRLSESPSAQQRENDKRTKQLALLNKALVDASSDDGALGPQLDSRGKPRVQKMQSQEPFEPSALLSDHTQTQRAYQPESTHGGEDNTPQGAGGYKLQMIPAAGVQIKKRNYLSWQTDERHSENKRTYNIDQRSRLDQEKHHLSTDHISWQESIDQQEKINRHVIVHKLTGDPRTEDSQIGESPNQQESGLSPSEAGHRGLQGGALDRSAYGLDYEAFAITGLLGKKDELFSDNSNYQSSLMKSGYVVRDARMTTPFITHIQQPSLNLQGQSNQQSLVQLHPTKPYYPQAQAPVPQLYQQNIINLGAMPMPLANETQVRVTNVQKQQHFMAHAAKKNKTTALANQRDNSQAKARKILEKQWKQKTANIGAQRHYWHMSRAAHEKSKSPRNTQPTPSIMDTDEILNIETREKPKKANYKAPPVVDFNAKELFELIDTSAGGAQSPMKPVKNSKRPAQYFPQPAKIQQPKAQPTQAVAMPNVAQKQPGTVDNHGSTDSIKQMSTSAKMGPQVTAVHNQSSKELSLVSRVYHNVISSKPDTSIILGENLNFDHKNQPSPRSPGLKYKPKSRSPERSPRSPLIASQPGSITTETNQLMAGGSRIQPIQPSIAEPSLQVPDLQVVGFETLPDESKYYGDILRLGNMGTDLGDASTVRAYTPIHDGPTTQLYIAENSPTKTEKRPLELNKDLAQAEDAIVAAVIGKKSVFVASGSQVTISESLSGLDADTPQPHLR